MDGYLSLLSQSKIPYERFVSLRPKTSFRIGGEAKLLVLPRTEEELIMALRYAKECRTGFRLLGRGTNLLIADEGVSVPVIATEHLQSLSFASHIARAQAGVPLTRLIAGGIRLGLGGMEPLFGIPGTVGGAVRMNAGAYGAETADTLLSATLYDLQNLEKIVVEKDQLEFSYRTSLLAFDRFVLLDATFSLCETDPFFARAYIERIMQKRRSTQPLELPNAGSVFRRPKGAYAAELIDRAGLKGRRVGDAAVSLKHAGFIVNLGDATAQNVRDLIEIVRGEVLDHFDVLLQTEIEIWTGD